MFISGCVQCEIQRPHHLHIRSVPDGIVAFNDDGSLVSLPSTDGYICPLCNQSVTFIDPEFGNAFCSPCSWMGAVGDLVKVR